MRAGYIFLFFKSVSKESRQRKKVWSEGMREARNKCKRLTDDKEHK